MMLQIRSMPSAAATRVRSGIDFRWMPAVVWRGRTATRRRTRRGEMTRGICRIIAAISISRSRSGESGYGSICGMSTTSKHLNRLGRRSIGGKSKSEAGDDDNASAGTTGAVEGYEASIPRSRGGIRSRSNSRTVLLLPPSNSLPQQQDHAAATAAQQQHHHPNPSPKGGSRLAEMHRLKQLEKMSPRNSGDGRNKAFDGGFGEKTTTTLDSSAKRDDEGLIIK